MKNEELVIIYHSPFTIHHSPFTINHFPLLFLAVKVGVFREKVKEISRNAARGWMAVLQLLAGSFLLLYVPVVQE